MRKLDKRTKALPLPQDDRLVTNSHLMSGSAEQPLTGHNDKVEDSKPVAADSVSAVQHRPAHVA